MFYVFLSLKSISQVPVKRINFIISVDGRVIAGSMKNMKFIATMGDGSTKDVKLDFGPGNMLLPDSDFVLLKSEKVTSVHLSFTNTIFANENRAEKDYVYNVTVGKIPFNSWYYVLYIYNLDNAKYKDEFWNPKGVTYITEYDSSEGSLSHIRNGKKANH
jgi:hypothetical protein